MKPIPYSQLLSMGALLLLSSLAVAEDVKPEAKPDPAERVAAAKRAFAESAGALRHYEWIETTVLNLKGKDKSTTVKRCYCGADGVLRKVLVSVTPEPKKPFGIRGKIAAHKKEEIEEYMEKAAALIHEYMPPTPARIEASRVAGNVAIDILEPNKKIRLNFKSYRLDGDVLSIDFDLATNRIPAMAGKSYLEKREDAVTLAATIATLWDGTLFTQKTVRKAEAKEVTVTTTNSGYKQLKG